MKRLFTSLLVVVILISCSQAALAADTVYLTRGVVADLLLSAADDYNPGVKRTDILKGDENGDLKENQMATRVEAFVMLSRAFGKLPTPVGDNARNGYSAVNFTDIPDWAKSELSNIWAAGIVAGSSATTFSPDGNVTEKQILLMIHRVYSLEGTNLKDDFYETVNKTALDTSVILPGQMGAGSFNDLGIKVDTQVAKIIQEIAGGSAQTDGEKNIATLYNNVMNQSARDTAGITPIKTYLDEIKSATTLDALLAVNHKVTKDLGSNLLVGFGLAVDAKDSSKYTLAFGTFSPSLGQSGYASATDTQKAAYFQYLNTIFALGGVDNETAAADTQRIWDAEAEIAAQSLTNQELGDVDKTYNVYTMAQLKTLFPTVDLDGLFSLTGMTQNDQIIVSDVGQLTATAALFDQAHFDTLKAFLRMNLLGSYGAYLNKEFKEASEAFSATYYGVSGSLGDAEYASKIVQSIMSDYLSEAYVSRYFSAKAKADVNTMVTEIIAVYKQRIQALTWMSDATKAKAIKKLDTMAVKMGYPDKWKTDLDGLTLKSVADGGSFFANAVAITKAYNAKYAEKQKSAVDKTAWAFAPYTVNACYNPSSNSIEFPAGILQAPFYDVNATKEENLGGIGYVIAHEITHAFDNNGAKYDEKGNATDWWSDEDYAAFQQLCNKVVAFYDGQEAAPGITCNGALTVSENIADLGAVTCITQVASNLPNTDYKKLYTSMAKIWCSSYPRETRTLLTQVDVHAPDKLRGSLVLATQDAFYKAFSIQKGDGMYIAPENRVSIW